MHVIGDSARRYASSHTELADALLLDTGNFASTPIELGGTGRTHDWRISRKIREESPIPVYLAGGLTPQNIADAIAAVSPAFIDGRVVKRSVSGVFTPASECEQK